MPDKDLSGTDTAASETGKQEAQDQHQSTASAEQTATETATGKGKAGEQTEQSEEEVRAAEETAERERNIRASKEGTPEWFQKKIDKVVKRAKAAEGTLSKETEARIRAETERDLYKNLVEKGVISKSGEKPVAADKSSEDPRPTKPRMKDFENADEYEDAQDKYIEDLTDWKHREREREVKAEADRKRQSEEASKQKQTASEQRRAFEKRRDEILDGFREEFGDEPADQLESSPPDTPINSPMQKAIWESEHAPKILKYLFDRKEEAAKIARMGFKQQVVEIDRIERLVTAPPRKTTQSPAPVRPGGGATTISKSITEARSSEERYAIWRQEERERARKE